MAKTQSELLLQRVGRTSIAQRLRATPQSQVQRRQAVQKERQRIQELPEFQELQQLEKKQAIQDKKIRNYESKLQAEQTDTGIKLGNRVLTSDKYNITKQDGRIVVTSKPQEYLKERIERKGPDEKEYSTYIPEEYVIQDGKLVKEIKRSIVSDKSGDNIRRNPYTKEIKEYSEGGVAKEIKYATDEGKVRKAGERSLIYGEIARSQEFDTDISRNKKIAALQEARKAREQGQDVLFVDTKTGRQSKSKEAIGEGAIGLTATELENKRELTRIKVQEARAKPVVTVTTKSKAPSNEILYSPVSESQQMQIAFSTENQTLQPNISIDAPERTVGYVSQPIIQDIKRDGGKNGINSGIGSRYDIRVDPISDKLIVDKIPASFEETKTARVIGQLDVRMRQAERLVKEIVVGTGKGLGKVLYAPNVAFKREGKEEKPLIDIGQDSLLRVEGPLYKDTDVQTLASTIGFALTPVLLPTITAIGTAAAGVGIIGYTGYKAVKEPSVEKITDVGGALALGSLLVRDSRILSKLNKELDEYILKGSIQRSANKLRGQIVTKEDLATVLSSKEISTKVKVSPLKSTFEGVEKVQDIGGTRVTTRGLEFGVEKPILIKPKDLPDTPLTVLNIKKAGTVEGPQTLLKGEGDIGNVFTPVVRKGKPTGIESLTAETKRVVKTKDIQELLQQGTKFETGEGFASLRTTKVGKDKITVLKQTTEQVQQGQAFISEARVSGTIQPIQIPKSERGLVVPEKMPRGSTATERTGIPFKPVELPKEPPLLGAELVVPVKGVGNLEGSKGIALYRFEGVRTSVPDMIIIKATSTSKGIGVGIRASQSDRIKTATEIIKESKEKKTVTEDYRVIRTEDFDIEVYEDPRVDKINVKDKRDNTLKTYDKKEFEDLINKGKIKKDISKKYNELKNSKTTGSNKDFIVGGNQETVTILKTEQKTKPLTKSKQVSKTKQEKKSKQEQESKTKTKQEQESKTKTKQESESIYLTKQTQQLRSATDIISGLRQRLNVGQRIKPISLTRTSQSSILQSRQASAQGLRSLQLSAQAQRSATLTDLARATRSQTLQRKVQLQRQLQRTELLRQERIIEKNPFKIKVPIEETTTRKKKRITKSKGQIQGYDVLIKVKGKYVKVNRQALQKASATGKLYELLDMYANRSGKLAPTTKKGVKVSELARKAQSLKKKFRRAKNKKNIIVEKTKYAIDNPTEKKQITFKGIKARKQRSKRIRLL